MFCSACHTSRQVQTHSHATEHTVDTMASTSITSSHGSDTFTEIINSGSNTNIDIEEVTEHFDTLGRVTSKTTKHTKVHRNDSVNTTRDERKIFADTAAVGKIHYTKKDSDITIDKKKKFQLGSISLEIALGIGLVIIILLAIKYRKQIWKLYKLI